MMKKRTTNKTEFCFECSEAESNSTCKECQKVYCISCFNFVHQGKIMKSHKLIEDEPWQIGHVQTILNATKKGIENLEDLEEKCSLYANENLNHNHDVFTKLHSLLETIEKEHENKIRAVFLEHLKENLDKKNLLSETCQVINDFFYDAKDAKNMDSMNLEYMMDDMLEGLAVGVTIDGNLERNQYKLKDPNEMENALRMLFDDTLKCNPSIMSYKIDYHTKYTKQDEIVFEKSFYGSKYNEQSNQSTPFKQDKFSGAIPKSRALVINKSSMMESDFRQFQLPFIPRYNSCRNTLDKKSYQPGIPIKNVKSQIVQIVSADSLHLIKYKTNMSSELKQCSIFNMAMLSASNILFQKDIIRYFLVNKTFLMIVLYEKKPNKYVDLLSQSEPRYSIRELFESLNAFTSRELCSKTEDYENCLNFISNEVMKYQNISKKCIPREKFIVLKEFPAKITNIVSPNEFHVINLENDAENRNLLKNFQTYYAKVGNRLPCLYKEGVYGAACFKNIWYRVQIMEKNASSSQHFITCYFVDDGKIKEVHWNSLKMLAPSFLPWIQMANKCSLANIEPLAKYQHKYTTKVCQTFRDLVESSKEITVQNQKEDNNIFLITMNIEKDQKQLNVATMLNNFQLTGSFNDGNENAVKKIKVTSKAANKITPKYDNYRVDVELLDVISPDEFYVAFKDQKKDVQKLHDAIQEYIVANEMIEKLCQKKKLTNSDMIVEKIVDWKINDHCLIKARATTNGRRQYYRGIVDEISTAKNECRIFLRDKGTKIPAKCIELQLSPDKFIKSSSGAIRCKLACIYPVNKQEQWSRITIDRFQDFSENFELFAINQCGRKTPGSDSPLPVILWGIVEDSKVGFTIKPFRKYNNLTDILIHEGLADFNKNSDWEEQNMISVMELRDAPWDLNGWMCEDSLEYEEFSDKEEEVFVTEPEVCSDFEIAINKVRIKSWISASAHNSTFIGTPSYVDRNGCICINNSEEEQTLLQIRLIIDDLYYDYKSPYSSMKFVANEPCIARWKDDLLYRGIVEDALDDDKYLVSFVDFGDHANVKCCDMFHEVIAHNIPILSNRYYVSGIEANDMYGKWSVEALDTLHGLLVDRVCQITLDDKYYGYGSLMLPKWVKQCSIFIIEKEINVKNFMLENELAVEVKEKKHEMSALDEAELDVLHPIAVNRMRLKKKNQELMDLVDSINIFESVNSSTEECQQFMASQPKNSQRFVMKVVEQVASDDSENTKKEDYQSFCNRKAYKQKLLNKPPKQLEELELHTMDIMVFKCEVKCIVTSTDFIVLPLIDEHLESMERLEDFLEEVDPVKLQSVTKPIVNGIYLAKFSEDSKWYRAMVLKDVGESVIVTYVDHMNTENVDVENLRQIPINLYGFKKRGISIKLFNVKHNEQENRRDVKYVLAKLFEGKILTAVVRDYDDRKIPIIELIDENTNELIYQELIDNSMLISLY